MTDDYDRLRAALDAVTPAESGTTADWREYNRATHPDTIRALLAERDRLVDAAGIALAGWNSPSEIDSIAAMEPLRHALRAALDSRP